MTGIIQTVRSASKPQHRFRLPKLRLLEQLRHAAEVVVPPLIVLGVLLAVWELACSGAHPALPPPSKVLRDTWDLIVDPTFDHGGTDKGLLWHLLASLKRV